MPDITGICHICGKIAKRSCSICGRPACEDHIKSGVCTSCSSGRR